MADFSLLTTFGESGSGNGQFDAPLGIATDGSFIYVVESTNARVQKIRRTGGTYVSQISGFSSPVAVAVSNDRLFVADGDSVYIYKTNDLSFVKVITGFSSISGVASDNLYLYVMDNVVASAGKLYKYRLSTMQVVVSTTDNFATVDYGEIALNVKKNILGVIDTTNDKVVMRRLSDLSHVSDMDDGITALSTGIAMDDTFIYLSEAQNILVQNHGDYLNVTEKDGSDPDSDNAISLASGILVDDDYLFICDQIADKILVWQKYKTKRSLVPSSPVGVVDGHSVIVGIDEAIVDDTNTPNKWTRSEHDKSDIAWT